MSGTIFLFFFHLKWQLHHLLFRIVLGISIACITIIKTLWNQYSRINIGSNVLLQQIRYCLRVDSCSVANNHLSVGCSQNKRIGIVSDYEKYKIALDASIYADLQRLMNDEKIYRNPRLNRDEVVARLGTSKKIFLEVLQRNINMNFIDYINTYRLAEAIHLLEESEYTNEAIAAEVGFGSVNTFYRQFRTKYGFSPSGYKKNCLLKSINNKNSLL